VHVEVEAIGTLLLLDTGMCPKLIYTVLELWNNLAMPCEGLKLTDPRCFWETSMHTLRTMPVYERGQLANMVMLICCK